MSGTTQLQPPRGLLTRVIKRLGLEQELALVRRNLGWFILGLVSLTGLLVLAGIGLKTVLSESGLVVYLRLIFSDTDLVLANWHSLAWSILESTPAGGVFLFLVIIASLMLLVRWLGAATRRLVALHQAVQKNYYGGK